MHYFWGLLGIFNFRTLENAFFTLQASIHHVDETTVYKFDPMDEEIASFQPIK